MKHEAKYRSIMRYVRSIWMWVTAITMSKTSEIHSINPLDTWRLTLNENYPLLLMIV